MITAGLKLTPPGGIALFRDDRLELALPMPRVDGLEAVTRALVGQYYDLDDVDDWVIAGGRGDGRSVVVLRGDAVPVEVELAGPVEEGPRADPARPALTGNVDLGGKTKSYTSYAHVAGQVAAAYCTSPFAGREVGAQVLVWDNDGPPRLYPVDAAGRIAPGHVLLPAADTHHGGPEIAARVLAQIAPEPVNLCFTGDRALDVGLNSALAQHPAIAQLWIPPFPGDSGAAFGAAALHLGAGTVLRRLDWSLHSGPELVRHPHLPGGWSVRPCRPEELARLLLLTGKPVAVLTGRGKLGPDPLGARSVLCGATDPAAKATLNRIAGRPEDRPLVPICLAKYAADVFDPGTPDPYRHFAHQVRPEWTVRIPAVDAVPGPMQTVDRDDDPVLTTILREYHKWGGPPVLCTAPADRGAAGHLADVGRALRWGGVDVVWSDNVLYRRTTDGTA